MSNINPISGSHPPMSIPPASVKSDSHPPMSITPASVKLESSLHINPERVSPVLTSEIGGMANTVNSISLDILSTRVASKKFPFWSKVPLIRDFVKSKISKEIERAKDNTVNLKILGTRISVLFKKGQDGNFTDVYLEAKRLGRTVYKQATLVEDIITGEKKELLTSVKNHKKQEALFTKSSIEDVKQESVHIKKLLDLAGQDEYPLAGFPPQPKKVSLNTHEEGVLFSPADMNGKVFSKSKATVQERLDCVKQLANVLGFLHKKDYYHCDIKPELILVKKESGKTKYYLSEFGGLIKANERAKKSTPAYLFGLSGSHAQRDKHAFAMTVFEILTGTFMRSAKIFANKPGPVDPKLVKKEKEDLRNKVGEKADQLYAELWKMIDPKGEEKRGLAESAFTVEGFLKFMETEFPTDDAKGGT